MSFAGQVLCDIASAARFITVDPLPDIPKEVTGQDNQEGDLEELRDEEEAEVNDQETGQPETVYAQGEDSVVDNPEKLDFPNLT